MPDFKLEWTGWVAFRSVFDVSHVKDIPDLPFEATHWASKSLIIQLGGK